MPPCHALLLRYAGVAEGDDVALVAQVTRHAGSLASVVARTTVHRGLSGPDVYAYCEFAAAAQCSDGQRDAFERGAQALPVFASGTLTVARLERQFEPRAASAGQPAPFHYVVETDPAAGWQDELMRWYDAEHMPGLAAVTGCVRAQRFVDRDRGPLSLACYDLVRPETKESPAWLAVRHTAWSDRVRPQFRNTKRTMFRTLPQR